MFMGCNSLYVSNVRLLFLCQVEHDNSIDFDMVKCRTLKWFNQVSQSNEVQTQCHGANCHKPYRLKI